jgi:uncharacterized lipoprotein YddW (UPF0748 family)
VTRKKNTFSSIKKLKPWVQFGISPFGVWRNKSVDPRDRIPADKLIMMTFADPMAWMQDNYIDILPQLYWSIDHRTASYAKLIKWWAENKKTQQYILGTEATRLILTLIKNGSTK